MNIKKEIPFSDEFLPLQNFFNALREQDFDIGFSEYDALLKVLLTGFRFDEEKDLLSHDNLLFLCKSLWLKSAQNEQLFLQIFEDTFRPFALPTRIQKTHNAPQKPGTWEEIPSHAQQTMRDNSQFFSQGIDGENMHQEPEKSQETSQKIVETPTMPQDFFLKIELGEGEYAGDISEQDAAIPAKKNFLFHEEYFNFTSRQVQQIFRFLPILQYKNSTEKIDFSQTLKHWAKVGFFEKPIFEKQPIFYNRVFFIRDNKGSMLSFDAFGDMIGEELRAIFSADFEEYFFYNAPQGYFYRDKAHIAYENSENFWQEVARKQTLVIIFSDAGAARGANNDGRFKANLRFLLRLKQCAHRVVWLNPMPETRWEKTTARRTSRFVKMFSLDKLKNLQNAIRFLRGKK